MREIADFVNNPSNLSRKWRYDRCREPLGKYPGIFEPIPAPSYSTEGFSSCGPGLGNDRP
jgi:hypothetical protein